MDQVRGSAQRSSHQIACLSVFTVFGILALATDDSPAGTAFFPAGRARGE